MSSKTFLLPCHTCSAHSWWEQLQWRPCTERCAKWEWKLDARREVRQQSEHLHRCLIECWIKNKRLGSVQWRVHHSVNYIPRATVSQCLSKKLNECVTFAWSWSSPGSSCPVWWTSEFSAIVIRKTMLLLNRIFVTATSFLWFKFKGITLPLPFHKLKHSTPQDEDFFSTWHHLRGSGWQSQRLYTKTQCPL